MFFLIGCGSSTKQQVVTQDVIPATATSIPTRTATEVPTSAKVPSPAVDVESIALVYNLPQATLTESTGLYASPNRIETVVPVEIPAGNIVFVMGRNATSSHLRVVWNTGVGWVPVSFTNYNGDREKLSSLPVFTREPPECAIPLITQFSLNSEWTSENNQKQRIAVVIDLFRSTYGDFPSSILSLVVNGQEVESSKRQIVERGQFSLKDVVFTLPGYIQPGDTLGYVLHTTSDEPLAFLATIFSIPENCVWETD